jgi:hypothetical protein
MKTLYQILAGIACLTLASCDEIPPKQPGKITFEVKDDSGKPLSGITVGLSAQTGVDMSGGGFGHDVSDHHGKKTDGMGHAAIEFSGLSGNCVVHITEPGYYVTTTNIHLNRGASRLEPWNPTIVISVKRILKPIAMFVKKMDHDGIDIPEFGEAYSYDLEACDWLPPLGRGKNADICFRFSGAWKSRDDFNVTMETFAPNAGDGFVEFLVPSRRSPSALRSDHSAPDKGYITKIVRKFDVRGGNIVADKNRDEDRNYYFRIRTVIDEKNNLISARYGKMYGDLEFDETPKGAWVRLGTTYLNPIANDRNVEFDPKRNLLPSDIATRVQEP